MFETLSRLFKGSSGNEHRFWPARGALPTPIEEEPFNEKSSCGPEHQLESDLSRLRTLMRKHGVGIYLVMEQDEHRSEYVADADRRIRFISQFTGSSAFVSVGLDWAELATDSRYYLIASKELSADWQLRKLGAPGVQSWTVAVVKRAIEENTDIGVDPRLVDATVALELETKLSAAGRKLVALPRNLIDEVWGSNRPSLPSSRIVSQSLDLSGERADSKLSRVREALSAKGASSLVVYSLEDIAWLLNLRGSDVPYVPVFKSFVIVTLSEISIYVDNKKLAVDLSDHEGLRVNVKGYDEFYVDLAKISQRAWIPQKGSWAIYKQIGGFKEGTITEISPINLLKAIKNCAEIAGIRDSQLKCSLSIVRYFAWLGEHIDKEEINEWEGAQKLLDIRSTLPDFMGLSFETISASGPNASAPHYAPSEKDNAIIRPDQIYLLDSGSQFLQGSTDITRTVHYGAPRPEEIEAYTLVLKGHIAVASCIFPANTSGWKLDILARQFLWKKNKNYGHGTGHGIGSYLNIHELPLGIGMTNGPESVLMPGHFVSDEPGFYEDNSFGVRIESDLLVVPHSKDAQGNEYYSFEYTTLVPFEPKLIDSRLLSPEEKEFINNHHQKCLDYIGPYLKHDFEIQWLRQSTRRIE